MLSAGVLLLACAGTAAGATWIVEDDGGAGYASVQAEVVDVTAGESRALCFDHAGGVGLCKHVTGCGVCVAIQFSRGDEL
jgi:hypothetical protein